MRVGASGSQTTRETGECGEESVIREDGEFENTYLTRKRKKGQVGKDKEMENGM